MQKFFSLEIYPFDPFVELKKLKSTRAEDARNEADIASGGDCDYLVLSHDQVRTVIKVLSESL